MDTRRVVRLQVHEDTCPQVLDEEDHEECYCPSEEVELTDE